MTTKQKTKTALKAARLLTAQTLHIIARSQTK